MDATTPGGSVDPPRIGALGQFEGDLIRELRAMIKQGVNVREAVALLKVGKTTLHRASANSALT